MPERSVNGNKIDVDEEGYLLNPDDWTEEIASTLAAELGIEELTAQHWKVIHFMRQDYKKHKKVPTLRRIKNKAGIPIKEIYSLFPNGPARKASKISGLRKPEGCI